MSKLLGIDLGTTKSGLARSDESGTLAFAWQSIGGSLEKQLVTLTTLILESSNEFSEIVFGLPSQEGEWKNKIQAFALKLKHALQEHKLDIPFVFANEDFSSFDAQKNLQEVKSTMKKKARLKFDSTLDDAEAARIMLQAYIDNR